MLLSIFRSQIEHSFRLRRLPTLPYYEQLTLYLLFWRAFELTHVVLSIFISTLAYLLKIPEIWLGKRQRLG